MSNLPDKDVYAVTFAGEYYINPGVNGLKGVKKYQVTVKLSGAAKKMGFLSAARNFILPKALKANYPDYKRFRTHEVIHVENLSKPNQPPKELGLMNRKQLIGVIRRHDLAIEPDLYPQISDLRQAIRDCRNDPESFEKQQAKRLVNKGAEIAVIREIETLNDDFSVPGAVELDKEIPKEDKQSVKAKWVDPEEFPDETEDDFQNEDEINSLVNGF